MKRKLLIILFLLSCLSPAVAKDYRWTSLGPYVASGGDFTFHPTNKDLIFFSDHFSGVYRSTNSGLNWMFVGLPAGSNVRIHPAAPGRIIAAHIGVYESLDDGNHWSLIGKTELLADIQFHSNNPDILYGCTRTAFLKSTDSGKTWSSNSHSCGIVRVDPQNGDTLYTENIYSRVISKSTDAGESWRTIFTVPSSRRNAALVFDPAVHTTLLATASREIFQTKDAGAH
jgi:hypothetical protein